MTAYEVAAHIRKSLAEIVELYDETLIPQRVTSGVRLPTEAVDGERMRFARRALKDPPMPVSAAVLDARRSCHGDLLHFARSVLMMCVDINGDPIVTQVNHESIPDLCAFLGTWAFALADVDPEEARLLERDMGRHASTLRATAYPPRQESMLLGPCPVTVADPEGNAVVCNHPVRAHAERPLVTCGACGTEDTVDWWMGQILGNHDAKPLVTADELISIIARLTNEVLTHAQIRQWAARNKIPRAGRDAKGRALYDHVVVLGIVRGKAA